MGDEHATGTGAARSPLRSIPLLLIIAVLVLVLTGWFAARVSDAARVEAERSLDPYVAALTNSIASRVAMLDALAQFVRADLPDEPDHGEFATYAAGMKARAGDMRSLQLAPDAVVTYVYPPEGNEVAIGHDLVADERPEVRADVERALAGTAPIVSGPYDLRQGGLGVVVRSAVRDTTGEPWGLAIVVLDLPPLLEEAGIQPASSVLRFALRDEGGRVFFGDEDVFDQDPVIGRVQVALESWEIGAVPVNGWPGLLTADTAPLWFLALAVLMLLLAHAVAGQRYQARLAREVADQTAELTLLSRELEQTAKERVEFAETLRGSEERFRRLFEQSPVPTVMAQNGVVVDSNAAFATLLGYTSPADLRGVSVPDLVAPHERGPIVERMRRRLAGEDVPTSYELMGQHRDGSHVPLLVKVVVIDTTDGPTIIALATDLRARFERERLLAESEALFRSLFERSPLPLLEEDFSVAKRWVDGLALSAEELQSYLLDDPDAVIEGAKGMCVVRANAATLELVGVAKEEALLGTLEPYAIGPGAAIYREELIALARGDHRFVGNAKLVLGHGRDHDVLLYWNVAPGFEETYKRVFVSLVDITELRRAQDELERYREGLEDLVEARTSELRRTNERLVEAQAAKDKFLAAMSHELRTPLNSIIGFSSVMLQGLAGELSDEQRRQTEMVLGSGKHLLGLINQVLDLSRVAVGAIELQDDEIYLTGFLDAIVANAQELGRRTGLEFRYSVVGDCPLSVHSDEMRVRQVVLNLLSNAFKFTREGYVSLTVHCETDSIAFVVADTGEGIAERDERRVFEPFYQVRDGKGDRTDGAGLGLPISKEMTELLGGSLTLESTPGEGSTFTFTLPLRPPLPG